MGRKHFLEANHGGGILGTEYGRLEYCAIKHGILSEVEVEPFPAIHRMRKKLAIRRAKANCIKFDLPRIRYGLTRQQERCGLPKRRPRHEVVGAIVAGKHYLYDCHVMNMLQVDIIHSHHHQAAFVLNWTPCHFAISSLST